eukprot:GEMP01015270.1.p1 GENE.GEMP01015270.1~~GEMP01015270.1.p1  ORF type:complete len:677 (+),score=169.00 GEMP01015270.1:86-2116(+)
MATARVSTETRTLDHLYDPTYITSHAVDYDRLTSKAMFKATNLERVPDHKYMFSELAHYPRHTIRLSAKEEIPPHLDRSWHVSQVAHDAHNISGQHRHRFHKRPLIHTMSAAPHIIMYEIKEQQKQTRQQAPEEPTRTIGTQSVYRESEAQTDPYAPEHTIPPNAVPEILTLAHLTYGNGLPASNAEVEIIERTRQKRIYENMLPPSTDEFSFGLRSRLMESAELKRWAERERQIEDLQNRRLEILKTAMQERNEHRTTLGEEKVERLKKKKERERDRVLTSLQRRRVKVLRQVFKIKTQLEVGEAQDTSIRDVIGEYSDYSSHLYAPKMRDGHKPETNTAKIEVQPSDLNSYADLVQLERSLPAHLLRVEIPAELTPAVTTRKQMVVAKALKDTADRIQAQTTQVIEGAQDEGGRRHHQLRNILEHPETPRVQEDVLPEEEELDMAVLLIQRVLRGRAAQNRMFEGKEKRLDLINELCTAERAVEEATKAAPQFNDLAKKAILENIQGTVVAQTLDDLSKELLRFQEERRIEVMVKLAERDRRLRQAQESGLRQAEERLREREDEMFRQIMGVHQGTMDSYLEDIITSTVEHAAKSRALTEARLRAQKINKVVDSLEAQSSDANQVRDLVGSFVLPHVQRELVQRRIKSVESQKFRKAARQALESSISGVENALT